MPGKSIFYTVLLCGVMFILSGCGKKQDAQQSNLAVAGLPPVAWIAGEIGRNCIAAASLLPEGRSPHDYAPGPSVLRRVSGAKLFLSCGMPFENSAAKVLSGNVRCVDVTKNIDRIMLDVSGSVHHHHHHADGSSCSDDGSDPHIWLSCKNVCKIAENIAAALEEADPANKAVYRSNLKEFTGRFEKLHAETAKKLSPFAGRAFFVYHPAFGYFAGEYNLKQHSIELDGREISAARMAEVIKLARKERAKVIFVQKQFNPRSSEVLAKESNSKCVGIDPLAFDIEKNIREIADALTAGFGGVNEL